MATLAPNLSDIAREAKDALERIKNGEPLTDSQAALIRPRLQRIADSDAIPIVHANGFYLLGAGYFPDDDGFEYLQKILMASQRLNEIDRGVHVVELYSRGCIGAFGIQYSDNVDDYGGDHDEDSWIKPYQTAAHDAILPDSTKHYMVTEVKRLRDEGADKELLAFYEKELGLSTFQGKSKDFVSEEEHARQNVQKATYLAFDKIIENPKTKEIGGYLKEHIKTGFICSYTGKRRWRFS